MKIQVHTKIVGGKVQRNKKAIREAFAHFEGKEITVTVERKKKTRSPEQNAYIHGYLFPGIYHSMLEAGWNKEELSLNRVKEHCKSLFLRESIYNEQKNQYIEYVKGTSECSTLEICEFIDNCIRWAAEELGAELMYPNEQSEIIFD
jgi:hypothetical protein